MRVLSLFDGMSCGQLALNRAGIKVNKYYASEIDKHAIKITQTNFPNTIQLGDVTRWREWDIDWSSIDLLIGGSPCQGFSFAGKELNFEDTRSKLFFVYVNILNHIKQHNPNVKFLLENVIMKPRFQNVISEYLGVEPIHINSNVIAVANRNRLYWTNFEVGQPKPNGITFDDIRDDVDEWLSPTYIEKVKNWKAQQDPIKNATLINAKQKLPILTARGHNQSHSGMILVTDGTRYRYLTNNEAERAMTVPDNYTSCVSDKESAKCLGNGWTVDVIAHILKHLGSEKQIYKKKKLI